MIKLNRILAATDFSECSEHALRYACEFAQAFGAELHLLHVYERPSSGYSELGMSYPSVHEIEADLIQGLEAKLSTLPDSQWQEKLAITRVVVTGAPFVEAVKYAKEHDIDLIVLGTHGRGVIAHMLMGSTAERVVRKAPCPVLSVRPDGHEFVLP